MANKYDKYWAKKFAPLGKSIAKHEAKISAILTQAISKPERSAAYWNAIRVAIRKEYTAIGSLFNTWSKKEIPLAYRTFLRDQMKRVSKLKSVTTAAKKSVSALANATASTQIVAGLYTDAISDMAAGLLQGNLRINRLTRLTQQTLIDEWLIDTQTAAAFEAGNLRINTILKRRGTLANSLMTQAQNGRYITIVGQSGKPRNYTARYYAEMVSRVKFHEAQTQSALVTASNYDSDLVRVSDHNTTTEICQEFEGKIYSISGKDKRFPVLGPTSPYHVNCQHYTSVTFVESLEAQNALKGFSDFSLDKISRPPTNNRFIPVSERPAIVSRATRKAKSLPAYQTATAKGKRSILKTEIAQGMSLAA